MGSFKKNLFLFFIFDDWCGPFFVAGLKVWNLVIIIIYLFNYVNHEDILSVLVAALQPQTAILTLVLI